MLDYLTEKKNVILECGSQDGDTMDLVLMLILAGVAYGIVYFSLKAVKSDIEKFNIFCTEVFQKVTTYLIGMESRRVFFLSERAFMIAMFITMGTALIIEMSHSADNTNMAIVHGETILTQNYLCFNNSLYAIIYTNEGPVIYNGKEHTLFAPQGKGTWWWIVQDTIPHKYINNSTLYITTTYFSCKNTTYAVCNNPDQSLLTSTSENKSKSK